jgi:spermidine synthase
LQFSSSDEYRYHEALIHPGLSRVNNPKDILVLGGGDGLAAREILKYPSVQSIDLVDLDKAVTDLFKSNSALTQLNQNALQAAPIHIHNQDAFQWLRDSDKQFDFVAIDFPDPSNYSLGKLYTLAFYRELYQHVHDSSVIVIQATSPYVAKQSFWIINQTLQTAGFNTIPFHCHVPSFGEWGYIMAFKKELALTARLPEGLKFISNTSWPALIEFPLDMQVASSPHNTLNNQVLVNTFEREWAAYTR